MTLQSFEKPAPYDNDNLRFRRAYIRERLVALKSEREALVAERESLDKKLSGKKPGETVELQ